MYLHVLSLGFLCLLLSFQLSAQVGRVAPKAGTAISNLDTELNGLRIVGKAGLVIGADWRLERRLVFLQPGLFLQSFNLNIRRSPSIDGDEEKSRVTSLKAPINFGWYFNGRERLWILHARGGIIPSYILGSKRVDRFNYSKDLLNDFQLSANLGLGIDLAIFTIDFSYEWGLTDFYDGVDNKNDIAVITLGLIF